MDRERLQQLEQQCIQNQPPACEAACPVHVAARALAAAAAAGDWDAARREFTRAVPFPHVVARCCEAPCEVACVRREAGGAIRIRDLERAALAYGSEPPRPAAMRRRRPGSVVVVGAGLCGLAAAYELARKGYAVTLFEAEDAPGGRACEAGQEVLPAAELAADLAKVAAAGAVVVTDTVVALAAPRGANALSTLAPGADAILLAVGAGQADAGAALGYAVDGQRTIAVDPVTLQTSRSGVYAGGGMLRPDAPWSPIASIADGRRAALSIDRQLQKVSLAASREDRGSYATRLIVGLEGVAEKAPVLPAEPAAGYAPEEAAAEAGRCLGCECIECVKACAYLEAFGSHPGQYARRVYNNLAVTQGRGTRSANKMINSCSLCRLCYEVCPTDLDFAEVAREARIEMVRQERMPASAFGFALEDLRLATSDEFTLARHAPGESASEALFFPGCQLAASDPEHLELAYAYLREHYAPRTGLLLSCCGAPADWAGEAELFGQTLADLRERLAALGSPRLILACPTCETVFAAHLPEIETVSLWEVLREVGPPAAAAGSGRGRRLALHDPCTARYQTRVQDAVRELLAACGYEVEELPGARERTSCCGFGGLMAYANPALAGAVTCRRAAESEADYVAYCAMCRDRFAARGKPTLHLLDVLFSGDPAGRARRRAPTLTRRAGARAALKARLLARVWDEPSPAPAGAERDALLLTPLLEALLEERLIRPEEVARVVAEAERSGRYFTELASGRRLASLTQGAVTYWAEYELRDGRQLIHTAYSHRMELRPPPWPPAEAAEHGGEREWRCAAGDHALEPRSVTLSYLVAGFPVRLLACPEHGLVLIGEELATGRMLEAELALEDK